jgi:hypothetical protein
MLPSRRTAADSKGRWAQRAQRAVLAALVPRWSQRTEPTVRSLWVAERASREGAARL